MHQIWPQALLSRLISYPPPLQQSFWFFCKYRQRKIDDFFCILTALQMKHSFWRINFYVIGKSGSRNRCKRCVQSWSFLADWKRLMLQKGFSHSFWCTRDMKFFVSNSVCFWRKGKCFTLLSQLATFFSKMLSYLRPLFVNLSTEKHLYCQLIVAFEKKT